MRALGLFLLAFALSGCGAVPDFRRDSRVGPRAAPRIPAVDRAGENTCLVRLSANGTNFSPLPDKYYGGGCQAVGSVQISGLGGDAGSFAVSNIGPVTCPLADRFAGWARYGVDRAARQILGSPLARVETMGSYSCRNVAGTTRRSAHSRAEAIDIGGFVLADGRRISVKEDWDGGSRAERDFLRVVHTSACKRFGTVLGPQYNAAHRDHFHLEQGDGSFCR
ncbi:extensin family protein [Qipengyuania spongiae]|uniref:Extensin family protein n=1 Tax=Qipengyuania spongiae TaxID=2909673 RepID=A0ABY5T1N9_9SPHN|nr:extensin family protein [Qipengyuania spongiae]UVI40672.1 extensin family protein [Qipengyuania spongiae]